MKTGCWLAVEFETHACQERLINAMTKTFSASIRNTVQAREQFLSGSPASATQDSGNERRRHQRRRPVKLGMSAHFTQGLDASVVNVSAGGILVESRQRLSPGAVVVMELFAQDCGTTVRGQVLRSVVSRLLSTRVWYRVAVQFDSLLAQPFDAGGLDGGGTRD